MSSEAKSIGRGRQPTSSVVLTRQDVVAVAELSDIATDISNNASWRTTNLAEAASLLTGFPFKSAEFSVDPDAIPLVRGDNVVQGKLRWEGVKKWSRKKLQGLEKYALQTGDVVLAMDRPWIEAGLKFAAISTHDLPCMLVQRVARLRARKGFDQGFLHAQISSREFTDHVLSVQTGTSIPHISGGQIGSFKFSYPSLNEQRAMARILGALDDKIELNRRMNRTLETLAQRLFKSWFVDHDPVVARSQSRKPFGLSDDLASLFPDAFEDSGIGPIPAGWNVVSLDTLAEFRNGLAMQKFPPGLGESLPVLKIADLRAGSTDGADQASADLDPRFIVCDGDLIFSWSGSLMVDIWAGGQAALNQHLFKVVPDGVPLWFCHHWILEHLDDFQGIAADKATTMGHIRRHHLSDALLPRPRDDVLAKLDVVIAPLFKRVQQNKLQVRKLAALRDILLPKLLSGEIRVPIAEKAVDAAT